MSGLMLYILAQNILGASNMKFIIVSKNHINYSIKCDMHYNQNHIN